MRIKVTQYGKSVKAGGWDPDGDSATDAKIGNHDNTLTASSCALTKIARDLLTARVGDKLKLVFDNGSQQYRTYDDTAPENEARVDLLNYDAFDNTLSDYAEVTLCR